MIERPFSIGCRLVTDRSVDQTGIADHVLGYAEEVALRDQKMLLLPAR